MPELRPLGIRGDARYRVVDEARIVEVLLLHGWGFEIRAGERAAAERAAIAALAHWIALGLPFEIAADGMRRFDPAEVVNFCRWSSRHRGDRIWEERFLANGRRLIASHHRTSAPPDAPLLPDALGPRRFTVTLRREFVVGAARRGKRRLLRLPLPLEDAALTDLSVTPLLPCDVAPDIAIAPGRLDARIVAPERPTIVLGVEASFTARPTISGPPRAPLATADRELYTRPDEGLIRTSPRIRALADELGGTAREPLALVERFWNHLLDDLTWGVVHYDELDPAAPIDWVLDTGWFDCQLGSALLVALCRAKGIPARLVGGYLIAPTSPSYHFWAEVWLDDRGWAPFDSVCSDLAAGAPHGAWRHYFFGRLDYRMKTQCLPRIFNLSPSVRFPRSWHALAQPDGDGVEIATIDNDTGALVYREWLRVQRDDTPADASPAAVAKPSVNAAPL
jgi:hypothetical protein